MRRSLPLRAFLLLSSFLVCVLAATRCGETLGPSPIASGMYIANVPPAHFDLLQLQLQNNGGEISGTACFSSSGYLLFSGVPVHGSASSISFTVERSNASPCAFDPTGTSLVARRGRDGMFNGTFHLSFNGANVQNEAVTFSPGGDLCATDVPAPCVNNLGRH